MGFKLDAQQQKAVTTTSKNVIVVAGAGSGKTRVLVERIRHLRKSGVRPCDIVAITFTNMAAQEMRERLKDVPRSGDMFIGTIHSFANQILKNTGKPYEIFGEARQNSFMQFLIRKYAKHLTFDTYLDYQEDKKQVDLGMLDESVLQDDYTRAERFELDMFLGRRKIDKNEKEYPTNIWKLCKNHNIITFDELLELSATHFKELGSNGVEHLLVDELQDIGHLEYQFLKALTAQNNFFVGDDWQAIYGFKGGNVKIFKSLVNDPAWERIDIATNYRSGSAILEVAGRVIAQCDDVLQKDIAMPIPGGEVIQDSKFYLEKYILEIIESGQDLKDWFLLVRSNKDLQEVIVRMDEMGVPVTTFRKAEINFYEMQDMLNTNSIKLLTIHMAKGLEAENVILWGNFPLELPDYRVNKDERRVLYVGITRAKKRCIILK